MLSKLIVPLIVVMACFIAYLGDYLGRRLGKRRLTLFGLRPRHTAVVITVVTGMLIATATLGSVMAVDRDVKQALTQFSDIKDELTQAKSDSAAWHGRAAFARLQAQRDEAALRLSQSRMITMRAQELSAMREKGVVFRTLQQVEAQMGAEQNKLADLAARKSELEGENAGLRARNDSQMLQLHNADIHLVRLQIQESSLDDQLHLQQSKRAAMEKSLNNRKAQLAWLSSQNQVEATRNDELTRADRDLGRRNTTLSRLNNQLAAENRKMDEQTRTLRAVSLSLQSDNTALQDANAGLVMANQDAEARLQHLRQQADDAIKQAGEAVQQAQIAASNSYTRWADSLHKDVIFEPDQLLAQSLIRVDLRPDEVKQAVDQVLQQAADTAKQAGAGDPEHTNRVFRLMDPADPLLPHKQVVQRLIASLERQTGYVVLRIQATRRFVSGEQVVAEAIPIPNRMVYARGQVLGVTDLDGRESERSLRDAMFTYLSRDLAPKALQDGMLPDEHNQISADMLDKVLAISREVRRLGRPTHVEVLAVNDTWCSQPLDVVFRVQ